MRIIIEGLNMEGKTTIAHMIARFLHDAGCAVEYDPPCDLRVHHVDDRLLEAIRRSADPIVVEPRQLGRRPRDV